MKKLLPFLILIFFVLIISFSTYQISQKQEKAVTETETNTDQKIASEKKSNLRFQRIRISLPEFALPGLFNEDEEFSKKELKGKYSVVNFFASWCTTCRAEHEVLLKLKNENIIDIYGIAWHDIAENAQKYLQEYGNPFTKVAKDSKGLFRKITSINAIPETIIVNPEGKVIRRYRGNLQEPLIDEIKKLLKKKGQLK